MLFRKIICDCYLFGLKKLLMKRTNYQLIDFLDFNPEFPGNEFLWKCGEPSAVREDRGDVVLEIPFQRQKAQNDLEPDIACPVKVSVLRIRAYSDKIFVITSYSIHYTKLYEDQQRNRCVVYPLLVLKLICVFKK